MVLMPSTFTPGVHASLFHGVNLAKHTATSTARGEWHDHLAHLGDDFLKFGLAYLLDGELKLASY